MDKRVKNLNAPPFIDKSKSAQLIASNGTQVGSFSNVTDRDLATTFNLTADGSGSAQTAYATIDYGSIITNCILYMKYYLYADDSNGDTFHSKVYTSTNGTDWTQIENFGSSATTEKNYNIFQLRYLKFTSTLGGSVQDPRVYLYEISIMGV